MDKEQLRKLRDQSCNKYYEAKERYCHMIEEFTDAKQAVIEATQACNKIEKKYDESRREKNRLHTISMQACWDYEQATKVSC